MRMRKILPFLYLSLILCVMLSVSAFAGGAVFNPASGQKLNIDGVIREYEQPVANYAGFTMLPLRSLVSDLGIPNDDEHIVYLPDTKEVTIISADGKYKVWLQQGNGDAWREKDGVKTELKLDCPVQNYNGSLYIPVKFVAESLDMLVVYDAPTRTVLIRTPGSLAETDVALSISSEDEVTKLAADLKLDMSMKVLGMTESVNLTGKLSMDVSDTEKPLMSAVLDMDAAGQKEKIEMYSDGADMYTAYGGVVSKTSLSSGADLPANDPAAFPSIISDEKFTAMIAEIENGMRARLLTKAGEKDGTVVLYGDLTTLLGAGSAFNDYIEELFAGAEAAGTFEITKLYMEIVLDVKTGLPAKITMDMGVAMNADGIPVSVDAKMTLTLDYGGSVTVAVPEGIKDTYDKTVKKK